MISSPLVLYSTKTPKPGWLIWEGKVGPSRAAISSAPQNIWCQPEQLPPSGGGFLVSRLESHHQAVALDAGQLPVALGMEHVLRVVGSA